MARINSYENDPTLTSTDKILGTNGADNSTKNFTLEALSEFLTDEGIYSGKIVEDRYILSGENGAPKQGLIYETSTSESNVRIPVEMQFVLGLANGDYFIELRNYGNISFNFPYDVASFIGKSWVSTAYPSGAAQVITEFLTPNFTDTSTAENQTWRFRTTIATPLIGDQQPFTDRIQTSVDISSLDRRAFNVGGDLRVLGDSLDNPLISSTLNAGNIPRYSGTTLEPTGITSTLTTVDFSAVTVTGLPDALSGIETFAQVGTTDQVPSSRITLTDTDIPNTIARTSAIVPPTIVGSTDTPAGIGSAGQILAVNTALDGFIYTDAAATGGVQPADILDVLRDADVSLNGDSEITSINVSGTNRNLAGGGVSIPGLTESGGVITAAPLVRTVVDSPFRVEGCIDLFVPETTAAIAGDGVLLGLVVANSNTLFNIAGASRVRLDVLAPAYSLIHFPLLPSIGYIIVETGRVAGSEFEILFTGQGGLAETIPPGTQIFVAPTTALTLMSSDIPNITAANGTGQTGDTTLYITGDSTAELTVGLNFYALGSNVSSDNGLMNIISSAYDVALDRTLVTLSEPLVNTIRGQGSITGFRSLSATGTTTFPAIQVATIERDLTMLHSQNIELDVTSVSDDLESGDLTLTGLTGTGNSLAISDTGVLSRTAGGGGSSDTIDNQNGADADEPATIRVWTGTLAEYNALTPEADILYNVTDDAADLGGGTSDMIDNQNGADADEPAAFRVWSGTLAEYSALTPEDDTIYNITDDSNSTGVGGGTSDTIDNQNGEDADEPETFRVWSGTLAEYNALTPDADTLYNITDDSASSGVANLQLGLTSTTALRGDYPTDAGATFAGTLTNAVSVITQLTGTTNTVPPAVGSLQFWCGTEAEYASITIKDANTIYLQT